MAPAPTEKVLQKYSLGAPAGAPIVQCWASEKCSKNAVLGPNLYIPAAICLMRAGLPLHFSRTFRCTFYLTNTPKQMIASSRYQNYFPTLPTEIQQDVFNRMNQLLTEEKEYCDRGNYAHMSQILTSIALYEVHQKHGYSEEEAYRVVSEEMWKFLDPSGMQKLAKKSFFLSLMKKIVPFGFKKGSGYGWRYTWHKDDPKDEFNFECNELRLRI